eukprot:489578_1
MASRVLWLIFASWAVFLSMFAFAAEYNPDAVKDSGASDKRTDNNVIDWMGLSRDEFIEKCPPGPVDYEGLLYYATPQDVSTIYALYGRKELSIGMCVQLLTIHRKLSEISVKSNERIIF